MRAGSSWGRVYILYTRKWSDSPEGLERDDSAVWTAGWGLGQAGNHLAGPFSVLLVLLSSGHCSSLRGAVTDCVPKGVLQEHVSLQKGMALQAKHILAIHYVWRQWMSQKRCQAHVAPL